MHPTDTRAIHSANAIPTVSTNLGSYLGIALGPYAHRTLAAVAVHTARNLLYSGPTLSISYSVISHS